MLKGARQHYAAEVRAMSALVMAAAAAVAKMEPEWIGLVDEADRPIRWDADEAEVITDLLLVTPGQVQGSLNLERRRWVGRAKMDGYEPGEAGTVVPYYGLYYGVDNSVAYNSDRRQGNVLAF